MKKTLSATERHLATGIIRWSDEEQSYVGTAADGVEVLLPATLERLAGYLDENPRREDW